MNELRIAALVMAAGESSRFGGCKHLAKIDGVPMLQRSVEHVRDLVAETCVVTGAWHRDISEAMETEDVSGATLIHNIEWQRGLGRSIAVGVEALGNEFDGVLILLADQVAIVAEDIQSLLARFDGANIVCSHFVGRRGVPAIFGACHFDRLKNLDGDVGARHLLKRAELPIVACQIPRAAVDIDTRKALADWMVRDPA